MSGCSIRVPRRTTRSAPDGRTLVWALHATVDDDGRHFPADLWRSSIDALDAPPTRLTAGRSPAWSPDGSTIAFLAGPDHARPSPAVCPAGERLDGAAARGDPPGLRGERRLVRRRRALLVLAADPGSYALDWSARFVTGADGVAATDPPTARRVAAAVPRGRRDGRGGRGRARRGSASGRSTGTAAPPSSPSSPRTPAATAGTAATSRCSTWPGGRRARSYEPRRIARGRGAVAGRRARRRDRRLLERSRPAHRQRHRRSTLRAAASTDPWPGLETVGRVSWADDEHLWYARYDGTGTAIGELWLDGRREERWAGDAFIGPDLTKPSLELVGGGPSSRPTRRTACRRSWRRSTSRPATGRA